MKIYYYIYYKLLKFTKWSPSIFPSDFNAVVLLNGLEIAFIASICFFIEVYNKKIMSDSIFSLELIIPSVFIVILNATIFSNKNKELVNYIKSFDLWPKQKNIRGTIGVVILVICIILLCIISGDLSGKYNSLNNR